MLFKELEKIAATIAFYDNKEGWRTFVEEVMKNDFQTLRSIRPDTGPTADPSLQWTQMAVGAGWYSRLIKPLPVVVEIMSDIIRAHQEPAYIRAALAGSLAYLVQENDLIPDSAGGGYGLVDDALVVFYTYYKFLKDKATREPQTTELLTPYALEMEKIIRTGLRIFPMESIGKLRRVFSEIAAGFYHLPEMPTRIMDQVAEQIIQRPLQSGINQVLTRLAYHLDIQFQPVSGMLSDPILAQVQALELEIGSSPGETISESYYF